MLLYHNSTTSSFKIVQCGKLFCSTSRGCLIFVLLRSVVLFCVCRSEIHENINCSRCQNYDDGLENTEENVEKITNKNSQSQQEVSDIGGFAELAGCLQKLKSSQKQVGHYTAIAFTSVYLFF